jgi:hypothetical protein
MTAGPRLADRRAEPVPRRFTMYSKIQVVFDAAEP